MLKLATVFENAAGKNHRWSYNNPNPNKTADQIKAALETLTTLNLFQKDGVRQFYKVVSAKFVETIETPIFDLSNQAETYVADPNNAFAPFIIADEPTQVSELAEEPKPVVREASQEQPVVKPVEVPVPAVVEAASTIKTAPVISKAKAALETAMAKPAASTPTEDPMVDSAVVEKAVRKSGDASPSAEQLEDAETEPEAPVAESPTVKKSTNPRKEKVDRLRAYHEANKKKKGKKKKR